MPPNLQKSLTVHKRALQQQSAGLLGHTVPGEEVPEELAQVGVIWLVIKAQAAAVLEVGCELHWEAFAEHLNRRGHLLLADLLVLLLLCERLQALQSSTNLFEV